jgi:4-hydroxybenzoate polyprenyltransferase
MRNILTELSNLILPEYFIITISTIITASLFNNNLNIQLIPLIIIFSLVMIGLNTFNSIFDVEIDKINKPDRPSISGKLTKIQINLIWVLSFSSALMLSILINSNLTIVTIIAIILAIIYSLPPIRLRNHFIGSSLVGGFIYGAFPYLLVNLISNNLINLSYIGLFFGILFSITPLKDIEDIIGDKKHNIKSMPVLIGEIKTIQFSTIALLIITSLFLIINLSSNYLLIIAFILTTIIIIHLNKYSKNKITKKHQRTTQSMIVTIAMITVILIELIYGLIIYLN